MNDIEATIFKLSGAAFGPLTIALILGTGLYLTVGLRFQSILRIPEALRLLLHPRSRGAARGGGEISPFGALMTALSATVGVGNIAGVATAIAMGGPGAVFWMWMTALVGMATKYSETFLAVEYRQVTPNGNYLGGPMYYIKYGLGGRWTWLGTAFAIFASVAALGVGNSVQSNTIADALAAEFGVPLWVSAVLIGILTFAVVIGGLKRIAAVSEKLVPAMIVFYIAAALIILVMNAAAIPGALAMIFTDAFTGTAAVGGFTGAAVAQAIQFGVARGIFSNEAGLGSAAIAHATARNDDSVRQGAIGMLGTCIDTLFVNTMTALVIITSGVWMAGDTGAPLTAAAFDAGLPGAGSFIVTIGIVLFAFTTILGWGLYGERCAAYLFGERVLVPYRYLWCLIAPFGALAKVEIAWALADIMNALMAAPNLIALLVLSPVIFKAARARLGQGQPLLKDDPPTAP
ncbi:MAG: sodium:alanine symporter family protein [Rhodospirillaceae bacterium]|nr:sodium:alanine symporter family protein [Rhodospirillaceae bacterium]